MASGPRDNGGALNLCPVLKQVLWNGVLIIVNEPAEEFDEPETYQNYLEGIRGISSAFDPHS